MAVNNKKPLLQGKTTNQNKLIESNCILFKNKNQFTVKKYGCPSHQVLPIARPG
jgi:hypothetical protein